MKNKTKNNIQILLKYRAKVSRNLVRFLFISALLLIPSMYDGINKESIICIGLLISGFIMGILFAQTDRQE